MNRFLLLAAAAALLTTPALAADLAATGGYKDAPIISTPANWTGFYVGGNVGGAWTQLDSSLNLSDGLGDTLNLNHTNAASGIAGGGQAGYNFQNGALVLGVEGDFGILGVSQTRDVVALTAGTDSIALGTKLDGGFAADITGRIGYAAGPALLYFKGGWAYLDATVGIDAPSPYNVQKSGFSGWTLGGGMEYLLSPNWSVKAEYQYFDFGSVALDPIGKADSTLVGKYPINNDLTANVVKVGLNYHIGALLK